jgi:predicted MFS family arabinose efflux permease
VEKVPPPRSPIFVPRFTLFLLAGFALTALLAMLYALPVMLETPPPGASPDYVQERVRAHVEGKVSWIMVASFGIVAAVASRWMRR